jgi:hypothetical protein
VSIFFRSAQWRSNMSAMEALMAEGEAELWALEERRHRAEAEGRWLEAEEWQQRMRDCNLRLGRRLEEASKHSFCVEREALLARQRAELSAMAEDWEARLADYDRQAEDLLEFTRHKHQEQERVRLTEIREQALSKRLVYSKRVINSRARIEQLLRQRRYLEADELRGDLAATEEEEERKFHASLEAQCVKRERAVRIAQEQETAVLQQRIETGRKELRVQRQLELDRIAQSHQNAVQQLDQRARLHHVRTRDWVARQLSALGKPLKAATPVSPVPPRATRSPRAPRPKGPRSPPARSPASQPPPVPV